MTRRNKKKKLHVFAFPVPFAGVVVLLATFALGYVWLRSRCESLGSEIKALELKKESLSKKCREEQYKWSRMKSPRNIERSLARHNIVRGWPRRDQIVSFHDADVFDDSLPEREEDAPRYAKLERAIMND